jgi:hypothetical protein
MHGVLPAEAQGQFFPLTLWQAKNLSVTLWQMSLKTNGFLACVSGSGTGSRRPHSITSPAPSCTSATATPPAGRSRRGCSSANCCRVRTVGACSTTSCAVRGSHGGSNINSRSRRCLPSSNSGSSACRSSELRYPRAKSASRVRLIAVHGLNGTANVSAVRSAVLLTNADPDAVKGAGELQRMHCPATFERRAIERGQGCITPVSATRRKAPGIAASADAARPFEGRAVA